MPKIDVADAFSPETVAEVFKGENEMTEAPEQEQKPAAKKTRKPAPKKARKPATKAAPKETNKTRQPKPEPEPKPEPVVFTGHDGKTYELAAGVNPEAVQKEADEVRTALDAIQGKDKALVGSYLSLGKFQSEASKMFKSTKLYGQFLKEELPASQALDPALRSNCKWLYEALNVEGHEGSDLLSVLGVNRIEDFKSANPTVIKREYKSAKKEAEEKAKLAAVAEENGVTEEDAEKLLKEQEEATKKKEEAAAKRKLTALQKRIKAFLMQQPSQEEAAEEAASLIRQLLEQPAKEQLEWLDSYV